MAGSTCQQGSSTSECDMCRIVCVFYEVISVHGLLYMKVFVNGFRGKCTTIVRILTICKKSQKYAGKLLVISYTLATSQG